MKILIVDDSLVIRNRIGRIVAGRRFMSILTAANGREAIEVFKRERPQVVTLDITMPEVDGIAATAEMVRIDPTALILIVSAVADKPTAIAALKRGAHGFLLKPFTDQQLSDALAMLLNGAVHG
jgi:two-component system chemotaxis response regulator CheY